ncbi:Hypothetical predicted protein [Marmota monax]|uniref:Uncharacterized protein n=1 Tax=Marmota monax TaxID=9995 RepID=A0A5E4BW20_MARMO|nr:hypothetical protein GHT09_002911 [Marmota monax]VTJ73774.1 Hypothetical predicted protein [Marmota monax]
MEMEEGRRKKIENEIGDYGNETFIEDLSSGPQEENYISPGENSLKFPAGKLQTAVLLHDIPENFHEWTSGLMLESTSFMTNNGPTFEDKQLTPKHRFNTHRNGHSA